MSTEEIQVMSRLLFQIYVLLIGPIYTRRLVAYGCFTRQRSLALWYLGLERTGLVLRWSKN